MIDHARRSRVRDHTGPRPVERSRNSSSRQCNSDVSEPTYTTTSRRQRPSISLQEEVPRSRQSRKKDFLLTWMDAPSSSAAVDHVIESHIAVMVSLNPSALNSTSRPGLTDLSAYPALISESTSAPLPSGALAMLPGSTPRYAISPFESAGEKEYLKKRVPREMRGAVLGYVSFPGLVARVPGAYRIRVTLAAEGGRYVEAIDSEVIRVVPYAAESDESE
ncbi:hypothetical protein M8818_004156 [Zalaria obscura]|uniref:Uncharacterized protein n=1 Tax=Zalaria obscura TaxID=2024903 RepID=A0ACC3SFJ2_9PEZI